MRAVNIRASPDGGPKKVMKYHRKRLSLASAAGADKADTLQLPRDKPLRPLIADLLFKRSIQTPMRIRRAI